MNSTSALLQIRRSRDGLLLVPLVLWLVTLFTTALFSNLCFAQGIDNIRLGIIGCDTSHAPEFAKILNAVEASGPLASVRVTVAYPGGSNDLPESRDNVDNYVKQLKGMGIEVVDSIDELLDRVDAVLLESVDGRPHLGQARKVFASKKPVFIDKPLAASLADVVEILQVAEESGTPCFSASALRYGPAVLNARAKGNVGDILGCAAYSPCELEPHHADLFWYGVHGVETLIAIMGTGCESVIRVQSDGTELVVGVWKDGRIGTFRGTRTGPHAYGATLYGSKRVEHFVGFDGYEPLVLEIATFFQTQQPPVAAEETLEIFAFMEAADESKRLNGLPVTLESVLQKAREEVAHRKRPQQSGN
ncbi:Gfo/Idh/MocA family protein [Bythopirellula polymerisocia]|uniref:Oxidoreductase family, NAD-binding Rossmann fold n=1 Tax=Bythopirellula polymerisocia TaxID=2528003 RepID=A0A5C6CBL2_9BACT|nr:Gfo/Idh/MocA family oxidoreductase [Bythopirellula polymerisocia]TWU20786.1 Oxidoreductase family, NAD-binding Rossmann fold [Bythopirellula polymerisocia]